MIPSVRLRILPVDTGSSKLEAALRHKLYDNAAERSRLCLIKRQEASHAAAGGFLRSYLRNRESSI